MATYSQQQIYDEVYRQSGGNAWLADQLSAAAMAETGGVATQSYVPSASGPNGRENSWGPLQIYLTAHPQYSRDYVMTLPGAVAAALDIYNRQGMRAWSVTHEAHRGTERDYRQYLGRVGGPTPAALPRTGGDMNGPGTPTPTPGTGFPAVPPGYGGSGGTQSKIAQGQIIRNAEGRTFYVVSIDQNGVTVTPTDASYQPQRLNPGEYWNPQTGESFQYGPKPPKEADKPRGQVVGHEQDDFGFVYKVWENGEREQLSQWEMEAAGFLPGAAPSPTLVDPTVLHPTVTGAQAPDPLGAGTLLMDYWQSQMDITDMNAEQAFDAWQRAFDVAQQNMTAGIHNVANKLSADTTTAELMRDYMEAGQSRAANIATAQGNLNNEATRRAQITAQDILPRALPEGVGLNVSLLGNVPVNQVNLDQLMNQGLPSLASQFGGLQDLFPAIGQSPTVTAGTVAGIDPSALPHVPTFTAPNLPDPALIQGLAGAGAGGFPGFVHQPSLIWPQII